MAKFVFSLVQIFRVEIETPSDVKGKTVQLLLDGTSRLSRTTTVLRSEIEQDVGKFLSPNAKVTSVVRTNSPAELEEYTSDILILETG